MSAGLTPGSDTLRLYPVHSFCTQLWLTQLDELLTAAGHLPHLETGTHGVPINLSGLHSTVQCSKSETERQMDEETN